MGLGIATLVVPATARLTRVPRFVAGGILGEPMPTWYAASAHRNPLTRPSVWIRDEARWRDFAWLAFAATGGAVISLLPAALLSSW